MTNVAAGDVADGKRVLITDDSRFLRERLKQLLVPLGWQCSEAAHGVDALNALAGDGAFDLMLLDVNMPVMDGLECVRTLALGEAIAHRQ